MRPKMVSKEVKSYAQPEMVDDNVWGLNDVFFHNHTIHVWYIYLHLPPYFTIKNNQM